jgi:hypothetical protein
MTATYPDPAVGNRVSGSAPVVDGDRPIGIASIGDLAIEGDETSALADISAAESTGSPLSSVPGVVVGVVPAYAAVLIDRVGGIDLGRQLSEVVLAVLDIVDRRLLLEGVDVGQFGTSHGAPVLSNLDVKYFQQIDDQLLTVIEGGYCALGCEHPPFRRQTPVPPRSQAINIL